MPTATPVLTDLLDAIVNRLGDSAKELRGNLSDPALAEVRNAARAAERAFVLLSPWVPQNDDSSPARALDRVDILDAVDLFCHNEGVRPPTGEHYDTAVIESTALEGADNYVRVTMPGCVYLLKGEDDPTESVDVANLWTVEGRYPQ